MRVLAGVRSQRPGVSLGSIIHGSLGRPAVEASFVELGAEAEYIADDCKLEKIIKRCSAEEGNL